MTERDYGSMMRPMVVTESHVPASLVTKQEAANVLRVSVRTIDRYISDGKLVKVNLSARTARVTRSSLDAILGVESATEAIAS